MGGEDELEKDPSEWNGWLERKVWSPRVGDRGGPSEAGAASGVGDLRVIVLDGPAEVGKRQRPISNSG
jgi:hypothetical protein